MRPSPRWGATPADDRAAVLEKLATLLRRDKASLCALEILEAGKNWTEADADVAEAIDFCNFYAAVMRELGRRSRRRPFLASPITNTGGRAAWA